MRIYLTVLLLSLMGATLWADPVWIVNKQITLKVASRDMLKSVLLGRLKNWPQGERVRLALAREEDEAYETMLKTYAGMRASQFDSHWSRLVYTGQSTSPKMFYLQGDLVRYVAQTPGAMGCVDSELVDDSVRVLPVEALAQGK